MRTPHALVRACRPTTPPRSRPSRLLARLLARLPPGEPDETVHSPSTRLAVAPTTEPAAGRSTRTPWRTPRHASHYAAMTTQHSAHPPLPSAASLSLSISPLSFASTSLASFVPRLQWRAHKGCLGSDVSGTWWERTLTRTAFIRSTTLLVWTRVENFLSMSSDLHVTITEELRKEAIEIPLPQRDVKARAEAPAFRRRWR